MSVLDKGELEFSDHAKLAMAERGIEKPWIERAIHQPELTQVDPSGASRKRVFARIPEFGDRWLRVVYDVETTGIVVVTAFFDRNMGKRA